VLKRGGDRMIVEVNKEMEDYGNGANRSNSSSKSSPSSTLGLNIGMTGITWRPSADMAFGVYGLQRPTVNVSGRSLRSNNLRIVERKSVWPQFLIL
jgi:hypothetical protein